MSLMQLLAVGESLMGIRNTRSPYRIARENWLPDFSMEKEQVPTDQAQASSRGTGPAVSELKNRGRVGKVTEGRLRQGELALEQVQVMRNDLRESDVEVTWQRTQPSLPVSQQALPSKKIVVPIAKSAIPPVSPVPVPKKSVKNEGAVWNYFMRRMFRFETSASMKP